MKFFDFLKKSWLLIIFIVIGLCLLIFSFYDIVYNMGLIIVAIPAYAVLILLMIYGSLGYQEVNPSISPILENIEAYNNTKIIFTGTIQSVNKTTQTLVVRVQQTPYPLIKVKVNKVYLKHLTAGKRGNP